MTESPWANPPSRSLAPAPNWGFYLLVNLGIAIAVSVVVELIDKATHLRIPDIVVNLGVAIATVMLAGQRWLKANGGGWNRQDRHRLAFSYTMVDLALTVVVGAVLVAILAAGYGSTVGFTPEMLQEIQGPALIAVIVIVAVVAPLALWAGYGIKRLILGQFIKGRESSPAGVAEEFR